MFNSRFHFADRKDDLSVHPCARWLRRAIFGIGVCCASTLILPVVAAQSGQNYAFLVAAGSYDKKELNPLKFSCDDVIAFRDALVQAGFKNENIVLMHDAEPRLPARYLPEAKK